MKMTQTKTTKKWSIKHGAFIALSGFLSPTLLAEDIPEDNLVEQVMVTGSLIAKDNTNSAVPISTFSAEDIQASGYMGIGDFLTKIPSVGGADFGSQANNGNPGLSTASLRGLGPTRTLVLVNGQRPVPVGTSAFVDLNMIPASAVQRIEVFKGGASSIYGSDAIAGVINIITKNDLDGLQLQYQLDITSRGDGRKNLYSATFGDTTDKGNFIVSAQYRTQQAIGQGDRKFSECPIAEIDGKRVCSGSSFTTPARFKEPGDDNRYIFDSVTGEKRLFDAAKDAYNYSTASYMVTPQEVFNLFTSANYLIDDTNDITTVNAYVQGSYSNRTSQQQMAPVATFWGATMPASNPNNPIGEDISIYRRLAETGGRKFTQDASAWNMVIGLNGDFDWGWKWDTSFNYGTWTDTRVIYGQINQPRMETLLDPSKCSDDSNCPGVWNPLVSGTFTQDMIDYAVVKHSPVSKSRLLQFKASVAGDLLDLELPGGKPQWAIGFEHRGESASFTPDGAALLGQIYFVPSDSTEGTSNVKEYVGEINLPLLADLPGATELSLDVASRYTKYDFTEARTSNSYGLNYAPINDIKMRYTYAEGFRAPNIGERFGAQSITAASYSEPCINYGDSDDPVLKANCAADGLAPDFTIASPQATGITGGNKELKPETSVTQTLGFIVTPSFLDGFSATFDLFQIKIDDAIGSIGTDAIISNCYASPGFSSSKCALITGAESVGEKPAFDSNGNKSPRRNESLTISGQSLRLENLGGFETKGLDYSFNYLFDAGFASISTRLMGTWLMSYKYRGDSDDSWTQIAGYYGTDPYQGDVPAAFNRVKTNLMVGMFTDTWRVNWTARYLSGVDDIAGSDAKLSTSIDSYIYNDVEGSYTYGPLTLTAGIRNVFDKEPPYVTSNGDMNTINFNYDTAGRYFFTGLSMQF